MPVSPTSTSEKPVRIPAHIGIIMDGNGRWAATRGLPRLEGHRAGTENLRRIIRACVEFGVRYLTVYAFSTENWGRPVEEVSGLMKILESVLENELKNLHEEGVQIRHLGRLDRLSPSLAKKIRHAVEITKDNQRLVLCIAWNYGGRDELVYAVQQMVSEGLAAEAIDEKAISAHLFSAGIPDPDLIIRTSGEFRTSNFLIWQAAYAEWVFSPAFWPDFDKEALWQAILDFSHRERRFGKTTVENADETI